MIKVGAPVTVNALVPVVTTTVVGLPIVTSIPALPATVDAPITTTTCVAEVTLQDVTLEPEEGTLPIFAVHVCDVTKFVPVRLIPPEPLVFKVPLFVDVPLPLVWVIAVAVMPEEVKSATLTIVKLPKRVDPPAGPVIVMFPDPAVIESPPVLANSS